MALWGEDSKKADRPKHLNADEGPQNLGAAFHTDRGWEIPLDGHNPDQVDERGLQLSEVIAAQSNPPQVAGVHEPTFFFPQAGAASGLTAKVGEAFTVYVRTVDVDADALSELTTLTSLLKPVWATFTDLGNGVGVYTGTPTAPGTDTFSVDANDGTASGVLTFTVAVS